jgi:glycosyltransferase involved in cell wall biosynthesis
VNPRDTSEIAAAIDRLADDPDLRRAMGERARRAAVEHYNWRPEADRLVEIYRKVLHEDR